MRVLFDNLIYDSTITADTENTSYPLTNLQNDTPSKIYKATQSSAVITIIPYDVSTINCLYLTNTNATNAVLTMYDYTDTLLDTQTVDIDRNGASFTSVGSVSYMILTLSGTDTIYLGGIGTGSNYTTPKPLNNILPLPLDNSTRNISDSGVLFINRVAIRTKLVANFENLTRVIYDEMFGLWADLSHPVWVDVYENYTGIINPIFADMTMNATPIHVYKRDAMTFNFEEVR